MKDRSLCPEVRKCSPQTFLFRALLNLHPNPLCLWVLSGFDLASHLSALQNRKVRLIGWLTFADAGLTHFIAKEHLIDMYMNLHFMSEYLYFPLLK